MLDELRFYNRQLSSSEISLLRDWAPGPVGYWNMEEGVGTTAYDKSGNSLNAGWTGTGSHWSVGKFGAAANFNGTDDRVLITDNALLDMGYKDFSISAWANISVDTNNYGDIAGKGSSGWNGVLTYGLVNNNTCVYGYITRNGTGDRILTSCYTYTPNIWHYYSVIFDRDGNMTLYVDGVSYSSVSISSYAAENFDNNGSVQIGEYGGWYMKGVVDDVKIYNYARNQKQITQDMNGGHPAGGSPVGSQLIYWKMDEGQGSVVHNSSNSNSTFDGTIYNGTWSNIGMYNKSLNFNGSSTYVQSIATTLPNTFTFTSWFNVTSFIDWAAIVTNLKHGAPASGLNIVPRPGVVRICYGDGTNGYSYYNVTISEMTTGQWFYAAATYDGTNIKLYINGKLRDSRTATVAQSSQTIRAGIWASSYNGYFFNGLIDETKVYSYPLTDNEIALDYNHGLALQMGSFSSGTGNTSPATAGSQIYCVPGDTATCLPPVGEWNFEEGTGTTAYDTGTSNNPGILQNTPIRIPGKTGWGLGFDGSANHQYVGTSLPISPASYTSLTITAWVNPSANATSYDSILAGDDGGWDRGFGINTATYEVQRGNGTWQPGATIDIGQWQFIALVYSPSQITFYKNGTSYNYGSGGVFGSSTQPLLMSADIPCGECYFNGKLDNVKVYGYARSPAQVALDYNRGGPVGWWKFDECQGSTAYDSSGVGNTGLVTIGGSGSQVNLGACAIGGTTAWGVGASGKFNSSLNFDGTDDYVSIGTSASQPVGQKPRTLSAWIKPINTNPGGVIVSQNNAGGGSQSFMIDIATISGTTYLFTDGINSNNNITITGSQIPSSNSWHHVVFIFDGGTAWSYYLDGILAKNGNFATTINTIPNNISIGRRGDGANTGAYFPGQIDDVRIYNYALTSTQVKTLYSNGNAVNFAPSTGSP